MSVFFMSVTSNPSKVASGSYAGWEFTTPNPSKYEGNLMLMNRGLRELDTNSHIVLSTLAFHRIHTYKWNTSNITSSRVCVYVWIYIYISVTFLLWILSSHFQAIYMFLNFSPQAPYAQPGNMIPTFYSKLDEIHKEI